MKYRLISAAGVLVVCGLVAGMRGADEKPAKKPPKPEKPEVVMKQKLLYSHRLLTSLAQENFSELEESAGKLRKIAEKQWHMNPSSKYRAQLQIFWTTLEGIEAGAQAGEIEEATLAYMQMTLSCVRCHKIVRHEQRLK